MSTTAAKTPKRQIKGLWIPVWIWDAKGITWMQKCLLAEIDVLDEDGPDGGCSASNEYLGERFGCKPDSMANSISELRKKGFLKNIEPEGEHRRLRVVRPKFTESVNANHRIGEDSDHRIGEQGSHSNTRDNSTENSESTSSEVGGKDSEGEKDNPRKVLTDLWCKEYHSHHRVKYAFQGSRDGKAVTTLLAFGLPPDEIVGVAKEAWRHPSGFFCKLAVSICGLAAKFNEIRAEARQAANRRGYHNYSGQPVNGF